MGKRSNFERIPRDFYPTPLEAILPLGKHIPDSWDTFIEPCAGNGALVDHVVYHFGMTCEYMSDIEPQRADIIKKDMMTLGYKGFVRYHDVDCIITNPPWDRKILHPFLESLQDQELPAWLLFDADWPHTRQSAHLMQWCAKIVPIGRVKWIPGSKHTGKENVCWYLFMPQKPDYTVFVPREQK